MVYPCFSELVNRFSMGPFQVENNMGGLNLNSSSKKKLWPSGRTAARPAEVFMFHRGLSS